jgi:hypothetical protein
VGIGEANISPLGKSDSLLASRLKFILITRSNTGLVNVYGSGGTNSFLKSDRPKPLKTIGNLTTSISTLCFNHDGQLLAMASKDKKDQMRMVSAIVLFDLRILNFEVDSSRFLDGIRKLANIQYTLGPCHNRRLFSWQRVRCSREYSGAGSVV